MLIGTAVVGATTMIFGIIMLLEKVFGHAIEHLSLVQPAVIFGLLMGGAVIYWFTGASTQAVVTGAYRAVVFIKKSIELSVTARPLRSADMQKGRGESALVLCAESAWSTSSSSSLPSRSACRFLIRTFFIGYLLCFAFFGLFQAIFMAYAGGAWDNAKKIVEVDLKQKGTPLHAATVVGDTVGDPFNGQPVPWR